MSTIKEATPERGSYDFYSLQEKSTNGTVMPDRASQTIIDIFEHQVLLQPDKEALVFKDKVITYSQLNEKANQLALYLKDIGVAREDLVCICLEQSIEKIISMLAVLKAGAAYVPIDTKYPSSRISFILEDTRAALLITAVPVVSVVTPQHMKFICIDDPSTMGKISGYPSFDLKLTIAPSELAYVIYTSGSTGTPKGVLIEHRSLKAFTDNHKPILGLSSNSRTLQFSSTSFDAAVIDLWIPLLQGATVYLYADNRIIGTALLDFIRQYSIDTLPLIAPTILSSLPMTKDIGQLKVIGIGGEACPAQTVAYWSGMVRLINAYGPTEATVAVCSFQCRNGYSEKTIGKAMPGVLLYLADENGHELTEDGATGELLIGGIQLARGYLNRPELTAEKFVFNFPDAGKPPVRFYKTGDLVKRLPDGNLEYTGRKDDQLKLRGYRIEPGEIESALNLLDGIKQSVVLLRTGKLGPALTAFIVPEAAQAEDPALKNKWRQQLLSRLPAYMVPDRFELLQALPLNMHGKVDKTKLQLPSEEHPQTLQPSQEPVSADDYENIIRTSWTSFLGDQKISPDDDFFLLGGHSLLLMQVYASFPDAIKEQVQLPDLYTYPTIRGLVTEIKKRQARGILSAREKENLVIAALLKDASLNVSFNNTEQPDPGVLSDPKHIFLTGATGFVGVHLLQELLDQTAATIHCLVRAEDSRQGMQRIRATFDKFNLPWHAERESRILPVPGDLSLPDFGLSAATYAQVAAQTEVIYHSGSSVSYLQPYPVIKKSNIDGLQEIIRLATTGKRKYLALLSSMGVFSWGRPFTGKTWMYEQDDISQNLIAVSKDLGYIKSKWVMEKMVQEAMAKGLAVINFRLGFAVCNASTGATVMSQWWGSLVRSCVAVGAFPLVMGLKDELTTVDYMAKAIVHIGRKKEAVGHHFHLSPEPENDVSLTDFFAKMNEYYGLKLKGLPYQEWLNLWKHNPENPLYPLLSLFTDDIHEGKSLVEAYENTYYYDRSNTRKFLSDCSLTPPVFDQQLMTPYLRFMGILP